MRMARNHPQSMLTFAHFLVFFAIINHSSSVRTLGNPTPTNEEKHYQTTITFLMRDVRNGIIPSSRSPATKFTNDLPFSKPIGFFPPNGGIPLASANNPANNPVSGLSYSSQTLDMTGMGFSFPTIATLQELELGMLTPIEEEIFESTVYGWQATGKAQGVYVASSEDGHSHMMGMTVCLSKSLFKDGLRFFGVHKEDADESHIAVIGGTGKYDGANGYATVKAVDGNFRGKGKGKDTYLLFTVYLS